MAPLIIILHLIHIKHNILFVNLHELLEIRGHAMDIQS